MALWNVILLCRFRTDSSLLRSTDSAMRCSWARARRFECWPLFINNAIHYGVGKKFGICQKAFTATKDFFYKMSDRTNVCPFTRIILVKWFIVVADDDIRIPYLNSSVPFYLTIIHLSSFLLSTIQT